MTGPVNRMPLNRGLTVHTRQKLCHFGRYLAKAKLFCPGYPGWIVHMGKFSSRLQDLGRKNTGPGARFSKAPACKAIFSSSISKIVEVFTPETSCIFFAIVEFKVLKWLYGPEKAGAFEKRP